MNIIIAGDGEVGFYLAKSLTELNHNITVVDPNSDLLKRLETETDLLTITGSSTSPQVLEDANVGDCDLFLAVLHDENINLMSCVLAKRLKAKRTVARITNADSFRRNTATCSANWGWTRWFVPSVLPPRRSPIC